MGKKDKSAIPPVEIQPRGAHKLVLVDGKEYAASTRRDSEAATRKSLELVQRPEIMADAVVETVRKERGYVDEQATGWLGGCPIPRWYGWVAW